MDRQIKIWGESKRQQLFRKTFHHELGHAFGIGPSPAWARNVQWFGANDVFFVGKNAKRESIILKGSAIDIPGLGYDPRGVRLEGGGISRAQNPIPGHWFNIGMGIFSLYYLQDNDAPNLSSITLGAFEDIGWNVNYEMTGNHLYWGIGLTCDQMGDVGNFHICGTNPYGD